MMPDKHRESDLQPVRGSESELMRYPSKREIGRLQARLNAWFSNNGRSFPWRNNKATVYQRIIPEVLLQRTRADVVAQFLPRFMQRYPSWSQLATAPEGDLRQFLQPLGLWRRRAASLSKLANDMASRHGRFPKTRAQIESLPGVGQYIANAVMLFCHGAPEPLLDVNMARVLERYFGPRLLADIRYDPYLQKLARLVLAGANPVLMNWAILDLAALICKATNPGCNTCPLASGCLYARRNRESC